jgi:monofunctional biosynthetic peptidoglycan transglycosylase
LAEATATNAKNKRRAAASKRKRRPLWLRILRWAAVVVAILVAIPLVLTPLYRVAAPVSTVMIWRGITGHEVRRYWVTLDAVSPNLIRAVVASEDNFFCTHHGVDWGAVREVIETGADRGASTIAMQVARNLFLWQSRSYVRKALEVPLAYYADLVLGKRRVMEIYLNIAEWGPGIFGIEAAAEYHFGVHAAALTPGQSALLAVTLPNPETRDPAHPSASLQSVANTIAARVNQGPDVSCLGL